MGKHPHISVGEMDSPIGPLTLAFVDDGLCHIAFGTIKDTESEIKAWAKKNMIHSELVHNPKGAEEAINQLQEYFSGERREFSIPLCLKGTAFQKKVWKALMTIEYGETKTYKEIAEKIGSPKAVRAVGGANNKNPIPIIIPCHRVVGSSGALVGYGGGLDKKETLLGIEKKSITAGSE